MSTSLSSAWIALVFAGLLEVVWAAGMKYTEGFTKLTPTVFTVLAMIASFFLLSRSLKVLPLGTAYAVWVGIGALGAALFGILVLKEPVSPLRILFLATLIGSIIGLKATSA